MRKRQKHWLYRNIGKPFSRDIKEYAMMVFREEYEEFKKLKREKNCSRGYDIQNVKISTCQ